MSFDKSGLDSYNDVASRIAEFRAKHPDGSLQPVDPLHPFSIIDVAGKTFLVYAAAAYRSQEDARPGIGVAWEPLPGKTPYTKDSEVMVAETSAWGRAIVAALAADTRKGVASQDEVRNRQAGRDAEWESAQPAQPDQAAAFAAFAQETGTAAASEIPEIGKRVKAARSAREINPMQYRKLAELAAARLAELETAS